MITYTVRHPVTTKGFNHSVMRIALDTERDTVTISATCTQKCGANEGVAALRVPHEIIEGVLDYLRRSGQLSIEGDGADV